MRRSVNQSPSQVVHLLLCPKTDDLARVELAEAVLKAVVILDILVSVPELIQCRLKHLQHTLRWDGAVFQTVGDKRQIFNMRIKNSCCNVTDR